VAGVVVVVAMSRPSFRPRPLDIHKKLPILKSVREFEDDDQGYAPASAARAGVLLRHSGAELTTSTASNVADGEVIGFYCLSLNCNFAKCWYMAARSVFFYASYNLSGSLIAPVNF
jgi:hypothetical protein